MPAPRGTRRLPAAVAILALAAFVLARCDDGPTGRDAETVEVQATDRTNDEGGFGAFEPAEVRIRAGDTVRWVQEGVVPHTVTEGERGEPAPAFDALLVQPGEAFEVRFDEPGTFSYHCRPHFGMDGIVVVEP